MLKLDARIEYRDKRNLLTPEKVNALSEQIFSLFFQNFDISKYKNVHFFKTITKMKEVNTDFFVNTIREKNIASNLITSVSDINSNLLTHYIVNKDTIYKENLFRIPEPTNGLKISENEIDLVLVPMFLFDEKGHRVGYGKGYYDRFLREVNDNCVKVGVNFFGPIDSIDDADQFDVELDYCITPEKVYQFS
jgi:5-formyltetrahydrofolate cyclo-ligase